jgi:hypothetical protein
MNRLALALAAVLAAAAARAGEPLDCRSELVSARRLFEQQRASRLHLADPLARAVRQAIERLDDGDRALLARLAKGEASVAEVDRALWPKLFPAIDRFNREGCAALGGVVRAEEVVEASTALRGGRGLHTGVLVACARRPMQQGEPRRFLGVRVKQGDGGPVLALSGFVQVRDTPFVTSEGAFEGLAVEVPLGDRLAERAALDRAVGAFLGSAEDLDWAVPPACRTRVSLAR